MKIKFVAFVIFLVGFGVSAQAQQGGRRSQGQGFTIQERVDVMMKKIAAITLTSEQKTSLEKIFTAYFDGLQKAKSTGNRNGEFVEALATKRDKNVKDVLSASQYAEYKIIIDKAEDDRGRKGRRSKG